MKFKILLLSLICIFFGIIILKQDRLIKVPKEDRRLIEITEEIIVGQVVSVGDGDSFVFKDGTQIRLYGIDAPELKQTCIITTKIINKDNKEVVKEEVINCGEDSQIKLSTLIGKNKISCIIKAKDAFERSVGECSFTKYNRQTRKTDKININKEMILSGYAVAFLQISDKFIDDENIAKSENKGIWATTFESPSDYRKYNNK